MGHDAVYGIVLYFVNLGAYMNTAVIIAVVILAAAVGVYFWFKRKAGEDVPAGLQIWDSNGVLILDTTNRTFEVLGQGSTGTTDGYIEDTAITEDTNVLITSWGERSPMIDWAAVNMYVILTCRPQFTVEAGRISWAFITPPANFWKSETQNGVYPANFIYGRYV